MVRKDVRIGAVVLAILIAVIVVYVLVVPSGKPVESANADDAFKRQMIQKETLGANEPAAIKTETPGAPAVMAIPPAGKPATDPFADSGEKWMLALNTGTVPATRKTVSPSGDRPAAPTTPAPTRRPEPAGNAPLAIDPSARPAADRTHIVQPGESIARIAENIYGSQVYYKAIMEANPGVNPTRLKPGMKLVIPDVNEVKGRGGAEDTSPAPAVNATTEYRVVAGDSMHKIAMKLYGKSEMWEDIYQLNREKIGDNPAKLKLGMVLKLPAPPTVR